MPRKTRRPQPLHAYTGSARPAHLWPLCAACVVLGMLLGAGATYLALRFTVRHHAPPIVTAPIADAPPASLTAGLSAADAAIRLGDWQEDHAHWPEAIANLTQALALGADTPDVRTDLGVAYYKNNQPRQALAQYQLAHAADPHHENSLFNQGSVYVVMGEPLQAIQVWQDYLRQFPQGAHVSDARLLITQLTRSGTPPPATP